MLYIIKKNLDIFGHDNIIKFEYNVNINHSKSGFENFDIGNEDIAIDNLLSKLNNETILKLNEVSPIYISLSNYFFNNLASLDAIEYETISSASRIERQDLNWIGYLDF